MRIITDKNLPVPGPKIKTEGCGFLDPEFRAAHDKWLEDTFGSYPAFYYFGNVVMCHPSVVDLIKNVQKHVERPERGSMAAFCGVPIY